MEIKLKQYVRYLDVMIDARPNSKQKVEHMNNELLHFMSNEALVVGNQLSQLMANFAVYSPKYKWDYYWCQYLHHADALGEKV